MRVAFTVESLPEEQADEVVVEAEGPEDESRIVRLSGAERLRVNPGGEGPARPVR